MDHPLPAPDTDPPLDEDIVDLLNGAIAPTPVDAASLQRVKRRVLQRIAESQRGEHLTVRAEDGTWQPLGPGLSMKPLHCADGVMSYLVRLAPGAMLPPHRHPIDEECVVLEGTLRIGELEVGPGSFHLGRQDRLHAPIVSDAGALIYLRGAPPEIAHLI